MTCVFVEELFQLYAGPATTLVAAFIGSVTVIWQVKVGNAEVTERVNAVGGSLVGVDGRVNTVSEEVKALRGEVRKGHRYSQSIAYAAMKAVSLDTRMTKAWMKGLQECIQSSRENCAEVPKTE